jgi:uncharacterized membrane protein
MANLDSRTICALTLSFIALTDIFIALDVPILRQVFVFALLTFLPGFLLIQILNLTKNLVEKLLFLVGLSICFLMFVPLAMNFIYPALGISRPISLFPLTVTFSLILAALSFVSYWKVPVGFRITQKDIRVSISRIISPVALGAALILVLGILGALFVWFYSSSLFSLLSWLSIALIVALIAISRRIPERFYPLFVFIIALTLQYNRTLTSPNLFGVDAHYELYFADLVKSIGYWDPNFTIANVFWGDYFAMLSVTLLPNVYSILLNIDLVWVFKLVSPFIFAFLPLGLYELYKTQIKFSSKAAFLATFLFMSFFAFYLAMPWVTRQEIAELFMVLVILLITSKYVPESKKTALLMLFIGGIVVSHYSTSYIFLSYIAAILIGSAILESKNRQKRGKSTLTAVIVAFAVVVTFGWYLFVSGGTSFYSLILVASQAYNSLLSEFISPNTAVLWGATPGLLLVQMLSHYWQTAIEVLITIGLGFVIWRRKTPKMTNTLFWLSLASYAMLLVVIFLPELGGAINSYRAYSLALLFLAPCCVLGVEAIFDTASRWLHADKVTVFKLEYVVLLVVFISYFLFQCGFVNELVEHQSNYDFLPSQNQNQRVLNYSDNTTWSYAAAAPIPIESIDASKWLSSSMGRSPVYADTYRHAEVVGYGLISPNSISVLTSSNINKSAHNAYTYLGPVNVQQGTFLLNTPQGSQQRQISILPALTTGNRIYSNGLAEIYYSG